MSLPGLASAFHSVRSVHIVRPHVELPLARSHHAAVDRARVHAYAHVDWSAGALAYEAEK